MNPITTNAVIATMTEPKNTADAMTMTDTSFSPQPTTTPVTNADASETNPNNTTNPTNPNNPNNPLLSINKLVLSGGSLKGCAHIGIIRYLEETNILPQIQCIAGTSIGALIATLLTISYSSKELELYIKQFDYIQYQSIDIYHILECFGIDNFGKIMQFIATLFINKRINPFITFHDLFQITHKHLVVNAVCLNTHENTFFDYLLTPQMPVITAVRASMSLPLMFGSTKHNGLTYIDGGLLNNFIIDFPLFQEAPDTVLGIILSNRTNCSVKEIDNINQYMYHLFSCFYDAYLDLAIKPPPQSHIIRINVPKCQTYDFSLKDEEKDEIIQLGYYKIKEYFNSTNC